MRMSTLVLAAIAAVLVLGGVALAMLSPGGAQASRGAETPTITAIPRTTGSQAQPCCEVSENSVGIVSYRKVVVPADLLEALMERRSNASAGIPLTIEHVEINGTLRTAYGDTLVLDTANGTLKILVPREWRWNAAKYDLVGLFAEGILAKGMGLSIDAVKAGYKGLPPYVVLGYRITLPDGTVIEADLPLND